MGIIASKKFVRNVFLFFFGIFVSFCTDARDSNSAGIMENEDEVHKNIQVKKSHVFSKSYYILMKDAIPKDESLGSNQFIHVGLKLNQVGKFQNSIPIGRNVRKILITAGSSKANHWMQEGFRKNFQKSILELKKNGTQLNEIQLDFEGFPIRDKRNFSDFSCEVKKFANEQGIKFSLALFPPNHPDNKGFHDWSILKNCADKFYVMMYDMHNPRTGPGQVTSSQWIEDNLTLIYKATGESEAVMNSRIVLGLPLYGYSWNQSGKYLKAYPNRRIKAVEEADMDGLVWSRSKNEIVYMPSNLFLRHWEREAKKRGMLGVVYWRWGY
ncbi:MAG: hypothetical protein JJT78_04405 [Leptospira sp.]|nr:hypothetical protein [Leptospira sp.]